MSVARTHYPERDVLLPPECKAFLCLNHGNDHVKEDVNSGSSLAPTCTTAPVRESAA